MGTSRSSEGKPFVVFVGTMIDLGVRVCPLLSSENFESFVLTFKRLKSNEGSNRLVQVVLGVFNLLLNLRCFKF